MSINKTQNNKAFTLIELMIATTLFTIVMLMGVGALVVSSNSAKASQKLRISVDNVNFAMESMTRDIRMGTYFYCGKDSVEMGNITADCDMTYGDYGNMIAFNPQKAADGTIPPRIAYRLNPRGDGTNSVQRCDGTASNCSDIVSRDVDIQELKFYVKGSTLPALDDVAKGHVQPSVKILIKGVVNVKGISKSFSLQTMASQRSTEY